MKHFVTILFTAAILTYTASGAVNDSGAEERFRMKYGRNTPAGEARARAVSKVSPNCQQGCCQHMNNEFTINLPAGGNDAGAEERFRAKWGRNTPSSEAAASAAHAKTTVPTDLLAARNNDSGAEERFRMKFGRNTPFEERRQAIARSATTDRVMVAAADRAACDPDCCARFD
jgi:hypothetical protein